MDLTPKTSAYISRQMKSPSNILPVESAQMSFESRFLMAFRSGHLNVCRLMSFSVDYATHLLIEIQIRLLLHLPWMWKQIKHTHTPLKLCSTHTSQTPCRSVFFERFGFLPKVIIGTYHRHSAIENCETLPSFLLNRLGIEGEKFHITPCRFTRTTLNHSFQQLKSSELWRSSRDFLKHRCHHNRQAPKHMREVRPVPLAWESWRFKYSNQPLRSRLKGL